MKPTIYRIESALPNQMSIVARPRGGDWLDDEIRALSAEGIKILVSMLTTEEAQELGLQDEREKCGAAAIAFVNVPLEDRSVPSNRADFLHIVEQIAAEVRGGASVAVHCRAGIGRSSMFAASVLVRLGWTPGDAFKAIQQTRGCAVPDTPEQRDWVEQNVP